ncbi:histidine phosphatase family protein [bacterium]|nr:histidine phosphatase family protein [bacterium]
MTAQEQSEYEYEYEGSSPPTPETQSVFAFHAELWFGPPPMGTLSARTTPEGRTPSHPPTALHLQRHGESETNVARVFTCRRLDPSLTEDGRSQIAARIPFYQQAGIEHIVSSPSTRAVQSATILGEGLDAPVTTDPSLIEVDVGELEGQRDCDPEPFGRFLAVLTDWLVHGKDIRFPGGESRTEVVARVWRILALGSATTLLIGHCALFAVVLGTQGMPFQRVDELFLPRGGGAVFDGAARAWRVLE